MGKTGVPEVGLLESDGYWEWATRMEDLLIYKELGDCILRDGNQIPVDNVAEKLRDRKALSLIRSHVSGGLLPYLQGRSTAMEAWEILKQMYATSLDAKKSLLEEQLLKLSKSKSEDIPEFCGRAQKIRLELIAAGERVSEERVIRAILRGLPEEFRTVVEVLTYQSGLTVDRVMTHLRVAEERISGSEDVAVVLKSSANKKKPKDLSKIQCYRCKQWGHFKKDCPQGEKSKSKSQKSDAVAMSVVSKAMNGRSCMGKSTQDGAKAMAAIAG
jgi:hypothetical protein